MTTCWDCGPDFLAYMIAGAIVFFAPVGAFVLRKHIAEARGWWRVAGRCLQGAAAISLPFAALVVLTVVR